VTMLASPALRPAFPSPTTRAVLLCVCGWGVCVLEHTQMSCEALGSRQGAVVRARGVCSASAG